MAGNLCLSLYKNSHNWNSWVSVCFRRLNVKQLSHFFFYPASRRNQFSNSLFSCFSFIFELYLYFSKNSALLFKKWLCFILYLLVFLLFSFHSPVYFIYLFILCSSVVFKYIILAEFAFICKYCTTIYLPSKCFNYTCLFIYPLFIFQTKLSYL